MFLKCCYDGIKKKIKEINMELGTRLEARKEWMKLNGKKRFALMIMLGVERLHIADSVESCLDYIENKIINK